jgi:hypothetical protein
MKFARIVFLFAGVWGIAVVTPLFFLVDVTGRRYSPPSEYPQFFYGFLAVTIAWQIGFLVIGSDPQRFRPLMIPGIVEKMGYVSTLLALYGQGRLSAADFSPFVPDFTIGLFFIAAFVKTRTSAGRTLSSADRAAGADRVLVVASMAHPSSRHERRESLPRRQAAPGSAVPE